MIRTRIGTCLCTVGAVIAVGWLSLGCSRTPMDALDQPSLSACSTDTCHGRGTCSNSTGVAACACEAGYGGATCDTCAASYAMTNGACVAATCSNNACSGHGQCSGTASSPICACDTGYVGTTCSSCAPGYADNQGNGVCTAVVCNAATCHSHGQCSIVNSSPQCNCDVGYGGATCDVCASGYQDNDNDGVC